MDEWINAFVDAADGEFLADLLRYGDPKDVSGVSIPRVRINAAQALRSCNHEALLSSDKVMRALEEAMRDKCVVYDKERASPLTLQAVASEFMEELIRKKLELEYYNLLQ